MKPQLTLLAFFLFFGSLAAQVKFKVKLLTDNQTYQVSMKPDANWTGSAAATSSAGVRLRTPVGGAALTNIVNQKGTWSLTTVNAPVEAPGFTYFLFDLDNPLPGAQITYTAGVEIPLFTFRNTGACTGPIRLVDNATDPFNIDPNSMSLVGYNYVEVVGAGAGFNAYTGDYGGYPADCKQNGNGCIEVYDVALSSPTACGVADGSITVSASNTFSFPMQYSINFGTPGVIWQSSPTFSNLAAGDTYYVAVRVQGGLCDDFLAGEFELQGPLAAIIQSVDLNNPSCGGNNGSIVIHATSANGGTLQYAMNQAGPWQASSTFANLVEGTYTFWVRDITNNCQNIVGTYTLTGCTPPDCDVTYDLINLGNGRYEVTMTPDTTLSNPWNNFNNIQIILRAPTGGFTVSNITEQLTGVPFQVQSVAAPPENPGFDYFIFSFVDAFEALPFVEANTTHLFTFENSGACLGDSIRLMPLDDPATNNQNFGLTPVLVSPAFPDGAKLCYGSAAAICEATPPPAPACDISLDIDYMGNGMYGVSMTPDTTLTLPWNTIQQMNITIRTATGGFEVSNLASQVSGVTFNSSKVSSPAENPGNDYFSFGLDNSGTTLIPFTAGQSVLLFTFQNTGTCEGDSIGFMLPSDPAVNNTQFSLNQQITVLGLLGDASICFGGTTVQCDSINTNPCAGTNPGFTPLTACEGTQVNFQNTTTTNGTITSWSWNFGDGSPAVSSQNPSHTFSSSGNFEVSLTVTTQEGCDTTFKEFVTVFPSPGDAPVSNYTICNGVGVTIETPDNITSAVWSPTTGLDLTDPFNPIANPATTTVYTLTATNNFGCVNTSQVTVTIVAKPTLTNVAVTQITDCNKADGTITMTATGTGALQYGIDSGSGISWQSGNSFINLAAGTYNVYVRNGDGSCPVAHTSPIILLAPVAPAIISVSQVQPVGCNNNGSITINATGGIAPLQYSITGAAPFQTGNAFNNLGAGTYLVVVQNTDGTCRQTAGPYTFTQPAPPSIAPAVEDKTICVGTSTNITVQSSAPIASYTINGNGSYQGAVINGSALTFPVTAASLSTTTYTVVVSEANGCSATDVFTVTGVAAPTASFTVSSVVCTNGNVVLNFNGTASPNATLTWNLAGAQVQNASPQNGANPANATMVVRWATAGTKTVTLTVNNGGTCEASSSQTINVSAFNPGATFDNTAASCGLSNGAINMSVNGSGFNYNWSNLPAVEDPANVAAGTYFVTITDPSSSCQATASTTVDGSPALNITNVTFTQATVCTGGNGDGTVTIQLGGGTANYTYSISGPTAVTPISSSLNTITFSNLAAGAYIVTVTDSKGCTDTETVTVTSVSSTVTVNVTATNASCTGNNGSLTATPSGGSAPWTYTLIKNNAIVSSNQPVTGGSVSLNGLEPAIYNLIFIDANGCIGAGTGNVQRNAGTYTWAETITPASCGSSNGSISVAGPVGATYAWSNGAATNPISNLAAGPYTLTVTETNGCTSSKTFVVPTSGGQTINISVNQNASCGLANGSILYNVTGGGSFSYNVLGAAVPAGFGVPGVQDTIFGLKEGAYVLEITDLTSASNCKSYQVFSVGGSNALQTSTTLVQATACGNYGNITVIVEGGQTPYTVISNLGTIMAGANPNEFIVDSLYEGTVEITIEDVNGCSESFTTVLIEHEEPSLEPGDFTVTNAICPDEKGTIASTSNTPYQIFSKATNQLLVVSTNYQAPIGEYILIEQIGLCTDSVEIEITGPADWSVAASVSASGCFTPGSISLTVAGATGPYTYDWDNNMTGNNPTGLPANEYSVTITDVKGCTYEASFTVSDDCDCEAVEIFYADTFIVALNGAFTPVCLPTDLMNLNGFDLELNGVLYDRSLDTCEDTTTYYGGFDLLPTPAGYVLQSWEYGAGSPLTNWSFNDVNQLLTKMKDLDGLANWVYQSGTISGGKDGVDYSNMVIKHVASGIITEITADKLYTPHPSILVDNLRQSHVLIATDATYGCVDTLYINVQWPSTPQTDTIEVEVEVGQTEEVCIPVTELSTPETLTSICQIFNGVAQINSTGDTCVNVVGLEPGSANACILICDDLGFCDTTILHITVIDASTDIEIFNGFSPNGDGVNDYFTVKNIHRYPNNSLVIFNRWGKSVYDVSGYNNGWDGLYRGTKLPDGSYFYILNVEVNGVDKEYKGFIEIKR